MPNICCAVASTLPVYRSTVLIACNRQREIADARNRIDDWVTQVFVWLKIVDGDILSEYLLIQYQCSDLFREYMNEHFCDLGSWCPILLYLRILYLNVSLLNKQNLKWLITCMFWYFSLIDVHFTSENFFSNLLHNRENLRFLDNQSFGLMRIRTNNPQSLSHRSEAPP